MPETHTRPLENSYWIIPGRFLAGEYPRTLIEEESRDRIAAMLTARFTRFVDLTAPEDNLAPYEPMLIELSNGVARRIHVPIPDVSVPRSTSDMVRALDAIDAALEAGENVYVHCWGGVGRTGTVIACWLIRHGETPDTALAKLAAMWRTCPKSTRKPQSPETADQETYIRNWRA